jgi:lathosterol oxidase
MPTYFLTGDKNFWMIFLVITLRYALLASIAFLIFYVIRKNQLRDFKIQFKFPGTKDYLREIAYSVVTAVIFAAIGFGVFATSFAKFTQTYWEISKYGIGYFILSIILMIIVHDAYFYWTHRWMHGKSIFRIVHRVHHLSTNPSPWAAMSFHPLEAVIEGSVIVLIAFLFPVHPLAIGIFLLFMMMYNVYGHLGFELYSQGFSKSLIGKWINTSVNHNMHHQTVSGNYGLYFLWWDRWMGTLQPDYDDVYDTLKSRKTNTVQTRAADSTAG